MAKKTPKTPNIAFVGNRNGFDPILEINTEPKNIKLPKNQSKPFYHKQAKEIIRLFPYLYKKVL